MSEATEFPSSVGRVAPRSLAEEGITTYAQLAEYTERELLTIHGVGPKAIRILAEELQKRGMGYRED
ncbi:helix-hairpin-helix domain-containing protein [Microbacterium sp. CIAB417]|uniref:helix-hairpin-helix domain-containing protein n=1 Tax=Microbacterium sp. CIAB417 TaxID=2860287 RepID=UPI001FABDFC2|nr:helix-hairpin-helix domain-containing protein [Microbacterium sp. CIAB417]